MKAGNCLSDFSLAKFVYIINIEEGEEEEEEEVVPNETMESRSFARMLSAFIRLEARLTLWFPETAEDRKLQDDSIILNY